MAFDPKWTVGWTLDELQAVVGRMGFQVNVLDVDDNPTPLKRDYWKYVLTVGSLSSLSSHINIKVKTLSNSKFTTSWYVVSYVYSLQYWQDMIARFHKISHTTRPTRQSPHPSAHPPLLSAHPPPLSAHPPHLSAHPPHLSTHPPHLSAHPPPLFTHPPHLFTCPPRQTQLTVRKGVVCIADGEPA